MKRLLILLMTEIKAWRSDPISLVGGFFPTLVLFVGFGALFAGRPSFSVAFLNHDEGDMGSVLRQTLEEVKSPFGAPYYHVVGMDDEASVWQAFESQRLHAVWVVPEDFSRRIDAGEDPHFEMHFGNWSDDEAKNHRLYSAEIIWRFYERLGYPAPPISTAETYPRDEFVGWFPLIAVAIVLLAVILGGMFNMVMLTYKEHASGVTLEFGLAPRSLLWMLAPKVMLALVMGLLTGTVFLGLLWLWEGVWPGHYIGAVWLLAGLTSLFWIALALLLGLVVREYAVGGIVTVLGGVVVFFVCGALSPIRDAPDKSYWFMWLFPNGWAVDPLRDLVLFREWPSNWWSVFAVLCAFAAIGLAAGFWMASRRLRRLR